MNICFLANATSIYTQRWASCRVPCDHRHIPERSYALYKAIDKPSWRKDSITKNSNIVKERASWTNEMEKMELVYKKLLASS